MVQRDIGHNVPSGFFISDLEGQQDLRRRKARRHHRSKGITVFFVVGRQSAQTYLAWS
eukprot:COSAG01_NODE_44199_length_421_cov_2.071429_1_plen_57_part_01